MPIRSARPASPRFDPRRCKVPRSQRRAPRAAIALGAMLMMSACGGGGGSFEATPQAPPVVTPTCPTCAANPDNLTASDVQTILAQAVGEAQAHGARATLAVTDRLGHVLAVYQMTGAKKTFTISDGRAVQGGLENAVLPSTFAAIAQALTGAYLSSNGNAFSTRTAGQIIQENFNPGETGQPSGPLFGVQFSQFACSDVMLPQLGGVGPQPSPLGLSASPGGLPLYKAGVLVGGIGAIADGRYTIDRSINSIAPALNELIAVAGATGYAAPDAIRADRITAGGLSLRYVDSEAILSNPATHHSLTGLPGGLVQVAPFFMASSAQAGVAFGTPASGIRPDSAGLADLGASVLVDASNAVRYPSIAGTDGLLTQTEATQILRGALAVANHARAQIRQPLNSTAQVSIFVVDTNGAVVGFGRSMDAPLFGIDVALQKARTALFFSQAQAASLLNSLPPANYSMPSAKSSIAAYVTATRSFLANPLAFADGTAYSARAIANLARPFFPDGINGNPPGPLSKAFSSWSVFSDGLQLDLSINAVLSAPTSAGCTGLPQLKNGIQIFPGSVPIYRGTTLVGAIGVSGDGVDQDDMVAFLGLANAGKLLQDGIANAPANTRADQITPPGSGTSLLYVQCPVAPFVDTDQQSVCSGI